ncbi:Uncharacterised protein [Klebsiella pneumoniae]|nr:Uncharacterised protein [Klebsiella pneumoniae]
MLPLTAGQHADILFCRENRQRIFRDGRGNNHFHKLAFNNFCRRFGIQFAVKGDNTAECGGRVSFEGIVIGGK